MEEYIICTHCGTEFKGKFCPECGQKAEPPSASPVKKIDAELEEDTPIGSDIFQLGRRKLIEALQNIKIVIQNVSAKQAAVKNIEDKIQKCEEEMQDIRKQPIQTAIILGIILAIALVIIAATLGSGPLWVILIIAGITYFSMVGNLASKEPKGKTKENLDRYYREHMIPLLAAQTQAKQGLSDYLRSDDVLWVKDSLSPEYYSPRIIEKLISYLQAGRADSLKEALNLYEETAHRERMESMQYSILDSAERTAREAANTAQAARVSAQANVATAVNSQRIRQASEISAAANVSAANDESVK